MQKKSANVMDERGRSRERHQSISLQKEQDKPPASTAKDTIINDKLLSSWDTILYTHGDGFSFSEKTDSYDCGKWVIQIHGRNIIWT